MSLQPASERVRSNPDAPDDARSAPRRRSTPGIRAVAGGVLVAGAMLGVLVAPDDGEAVSTSHLIAVTDLAPGDDLTPEVVRSVPMQVPPPVDDAALSPSDDLADVVARIPIPEGTVISLAAVRLHPGGGDGPEVTVTVPVGRALGGDLAVGDTVDLIATYGVGTEGFSTVEATGVIVTGVATTEDGLGLEPSQTLTLRLDRDADVLPVVHASGADALSVIRSIDGVEREAMFRPEPPAIDEPR